MNNIKFKVCGMRNAENIHQTSKIEPDFMGFIFYEKSKRNAENTLDANIFDEIPLSISKVGVFVNPTLDFILKINEKFHFDYLQLHGEETPEFCENLLKYGFNIIKAFSIDINFDFNTLLAYKSCVSYFLFDTKADFPGGNGIKFDWNILKNYQLDIPFFLSGGIDSSDISNIVELQKNISTLFAIDVNSKFEIEPGLKDVDKLIDLKLKLNCNF